MRKFIPLLLVAVSPTAFADDKTCQAAADFVLRSLDPAASFDKPASFGKTRLPFEPWSLAPKSGADSASSEIQRMEADQVIAFLKMHEDGGRTGLLAYIKKGRIVGLQYSALGFDYPSDLYRDPSRAEPKGTPKTASVILDAGCKVRKASLSSEGLDGDHELDVDGSQCAAPAKAFAVDPAREQAEIEKIAARQVDRYFNQRGYFGAGNEGTLFEQDMRRVHVDPRDTADVAKFKADQMRRMRRHYRDEQRRLAANRRTVLALRDQFCRSFPSSWIPALPATTHPVVTPMTTVPAASSRAGSGG